MDLPRIAFKEWAAVVMALERGFQDVVFRRGGIAEERDAFEACHDSFLLWPTYQHQQRAGLRPRYRHLFDEALAAAPPAGRCLISSWAEVLDVRILANEQEFDRLDDRHVCSRDTLLERLRALQGRAFYVLSVRVRPLAEPLSVPVGAEQADYKSWIPVAPGR